MSEQDTRTGKDPQQELRDVVTRFRQGIAWQWAVLHKYQEERAHARENDTGGRDPRSPEQRVERNYQRAEALVAHQQRWDSVKWVQSRERQQEQGRDVAQGHTEVKQAVAAARAVIFSRHNRGMDVLDQEQKRSQEPEHER